MFVLCISLIACNTKSENHNEKMENNDTEVNSATNSSKKTTSDPMDIVTDDSYDTFENGMAELEVLGKYISEDSDENGMITLKKDGYKVNFALVLVKDPVVEKNYYMF